MCAFLSISVTGPLLKLFTALYLAINTRIYIYNDKSCNKGDKMQLGRSADMWTLTGSNEEIGNLEF